ncbi:MAG TPA: ABC transporter permease [Egibacteraceae bacterium]|nr:ABC transporter permease [Egibacteraceae bacterium]
MRGFGGLLLRDLRVQSRQPVRFLVRTLSQPFLLVFVFTYVFPRIGQGLRAPGGGESFTTVLVPGVVAIAVFIKGVQAVALPLVQEFGYTREVEDRVLAPLPVPAIAMAKLTWGAIEGVVAALLVFPVVALVPAEPANLAVQWPQLLAVLALGPFLASAVGLFLGTMVPPTQVPLLFSVVILPITFLGATYYPWAALEPIRWLQIVTLANPLVYIAEGFRMALTPQLPHMTSGLVLAALAAFAGAVGYAGVRGFQHRVLS